MSSLLSGITIYPIKSLGGVSLQKANIEERGLQYDRRWMLVDKNNQFLTQRVFPCMALLKVGIASEGLTVHMAGFPPLSIPFTPETSQKVKVTIWDDTCEAVVVNHKVSEWFGDALQMDCRLVYMPDDSIRPVDERYSVDHNFVSFADAFPFLLIGEASLHDLNSRLEEPVLMNRFRPNLVVSTTEPFVEDTWKSIYVGNALFHIRKPCARCVLTTVDQATALKGKEPLKTLATYRSVGNKILFGQNLISGREGNAIKLGDEVKVLEVK